MARTYTLPDPKRNLTKLSRKELHQYADELVATREWLTREWLNGGAKLRPYDAKMCDVEIERAYEESERREARR